MRVELLSFAGCPGHEALLPRLRELIAEAGQPPDVLELRTIETPEEAERVGFLGSPSVRVDGVDVEPGAATRTDFGLKCRIYRHDGEQSRVPPREWIRSALARSDELHRMQGAGEVPMTTDEILGLTRA